jgi:methionyl-tRNA synthetase
MHKLCNGRVPAFHEELKDEKDIQLEQDIRNSKNKVQNSIEEYRFRDALFEVIDLARKGNKYMQDKEPWIVAKTVAENPDSQKLIDNCLHHCLQLTANLAILINPFLPFTARKLCGMMKVVDKMLDWENAGKMDLLKVNYPLRSPEILFRKIEDAEVLTQVEKLKSRSRKMQEEKKEQQAETKEEVLSKSTIQFDDFAKVDLRVGTILNAEKVEKADKLLKLEVDMGTEKRTIVSGIALHFSPAEIMGKQVVVVANLAPRKMKGIESNGMILMAENAEGRLIFVSPTEIVNGGSEVK